MKNFLAHLYQVMADEAIFGIAAFKCDGECVYINQTAAHQLGADRLKLEELVPTVSRPQIKNFGADLLKHDGLYQDILVRTATDGTLIANIGVHNVKVDEHQVCIVMIQDVTLQKKLQREIIAKQTEIKAAYEELLKQNQQLKELDVAKNRFIALTTHELRTPLSAMVASAEILKLNLYDTPEQMNEFIAMIYDQGMHLQDLVNDILDFAKIQAGKMDFFIEERDVAALTQSIFHNFEGMAEANKVTLNFATPPQPLNCYFDEVRYRQVASNIINNAIKYNRAGGTVHVTFEETPETVKVLVRDSGKDIPKDQFDKVFNEFETIGQVAQHHKGTGLGMPISRKLTEGMGGKLLFDSEVGVGTVFWIELPKMKVLDPSLYRARDPDGLAA